jgi:hypothetical protein
VTRVADEDETVQDREMLTARNPHDDAVRREDLESWIVSTIGRHILAAVSPTQTIIGRTQSWLIQLSVELAMSAAGDANNLQAEQQRLYHT